MRLLQRLSMVALSTFAAFLSGCGTHPSEISVRHQEPHLQVQDVNAWATGDAASRLQLRSIVFASAVAAARVRENPPSPLVEPVRASLAPPEPQSAPAATTPEVQPGTGGVWACIANAETGGVPAPGPTYWTVYGVVTDVVTGWGTPEEQAAVFGGHATPGQELDIVTKFAADEGFGGWGDLTKTKCGLW